MGLVQTLRNGAMQAVRALGDIPKLVTYVKVMPGVYDPETGLTADTETSYPITVPLFRLLETEVSWFPAPDKTRRVIVPYPILPIALGRNDYFLIDGVRWETKKIRAPTGDAVTIFYLQSP